MVRILLIIAIIVAILLTPPIPFLSSFLFFTPLYYLPDGSGAGILDISPVFWHLVGLIGYFFLMAVAIFWLQKLWTKVLLVLIPYGIYLSLYFTVIPCYDYCFAPLIIPIYAIVSLALVLAAHYRENVISWFVIGLIIVAGIFYNAWIFKSTYSNLSFNRYGYIIGNRLYSSVEEALAICQRRAAILPQSEDVRSNCVTSLAIVENNVKICDLIADFDPEPRAPAWCRCSVINQGNDDAFNLCSQNACSILTDPVQRERCLKG